MKFVGKSIYNSDEGGKKKNVLFQRLFLGGEECQKQKKREDTVFNEMQNFVSKLESKRGGSLRNGGEDKD